MAEQVFPGAVHNELRRHIEQNPDGAAQLEPAAVRALVAEYEHALRPGGEGD